MADSEPSRHLSLIPYAAEAREVVLRHGNAVVVFDPHSQQLLLRDASHKVIKLHNCPYCRRPLQDDHQAYAADDSDDHDEDDGDGDEDETESATSRARRGFVNPDYFRMLANSTPGSRESSVPPSARRPLPALRSGASRNVSGSGPTTGAEFVGSAPAPGPSEQGIKGSSFLPGYFSTFFVEKKVLGRGGRGVVLLVEHYLDGVFLGDFACKRIPVGHDHDWLAKVLVEVQLLQRLNHPNLVSYQHVWLEDVQTTTFGPTVPCVFILQQYCNGGDLQDYVLTPEATESSSDEVTRLRKRKVRALSTITTPTQPSRKVSLDQIFSFFKDITSGLHHLHSNGYIHRDLKPSNVLLHKEGSTITVHVSDFGEVQATNDKRTSTGATGTISYCAPEVLKMDGADGSFGNFSTKSDIFSLGMIVYFMCFGRLPYVNADGIHEEDEDMEKVRAEISAWKGFDDADMTRVDLPGRLYRFLKRLLSPDPNERPSTEEILQSIKAGADLDEMRTPLSQQLPEDLGPRISTAESPPPQSRHLRRGRPGQKTPGLSSLRKVSNAATSPPGRTKDIKIGPISSDVMDSRDTSPKALTSVAKPSSPPARLMLPPPPLPPTAVDRPSSVRQLLLDPRFRRACRVLLFLFKVWTLTWPCTPYSTHPLVFWPLLLLAAIQDLGLADTSTQSKLLALGVHLLVIAGSVRLGRLCVHRVHPWPD